MMEPGWTWSVGDTLLVTVMRLTVGVHVDIPAVRPLNDGRLLGPSRRTGFLQSGHELSCRAIGGIGVAVNDLPLTFFAS